MKYTALSLLLLIGLLSWTGCEDDDPTDTETVLNYDGPNFTAPTLPEGRHIFAAYFPPAETAPFTGRTLERIRFWLDDIPESTTVIVYGEGPNDRTPGAELYRRDITNRVNNTGWYEDRLIPGIEIDGQGMWLAVEVELANGRPRSVGCDQGINYDRNGDLLLLAVTPGGWTTFNDLNGETVNWNIRGVLNEE